MCGSAVQGRTDVSIWSFLPIREVHGERFTHLFPHASVALNNGKRERIYKIFGAHHNGSGRLRSKCHVGPRLVTRWIGQFL